MNSTRARLAFVVAVLTGCVIAGAWVLGRGFHARNASPGARLFDNVLSHIEEKYVDSIPAGTLYTKAAAGIVNELGDPHSVFLDSSRLARVQASINGLVGSLGLDVDVRGGWVNVLAAFANTPAEQAGVRQGDRVVAIDGRSTHNWTIEETRRALRGSPGTAVRIKIERPGTAGATDLTLEREAVYIRPVQRAMLLSGDIGYVRLTTFSDSAALELVHAIDSLHAAGVRRLIFDLRGNPGGLLAQGTAVADLFLNPGQAIVTLRGRTDDGRHVFLDEHPQAWKDMRLAVLVDRGTASASEIVAGALQDHDRAIVIGRPSYGKGSAQHVYSFGKAAGVKLTTARWYTPAGRNIDVMADSTPLPGDSIARPVFRTDSGRRVFGGGGIVPDVLAGDTIPPGRPALFAAIGTDMRKFRDALAAEAKSLADRGVSDAMFAVTPAMRGELYARMTANGLTVPRPLFDAASEFLDRRLGEQTALIAFGAPAEWRRIALGDKVVAQAVEALKK